MKYFLTTIGTFQIYIQDLSEEYKNERANYFKEMGDVIFSKVLPNKVFNILEPTEDRFEYDNNLQATLILYIYVYISTDYKGKY